jgi:cytochrome c biogenesis factor
MSGAAILNREELDKLERRELQLTVLSVVFVLVLAGGLAAFMYPLVFVHAEGNKWTVRVAFFGFCALTLLLVGYLLERQRTVRALKQHLLAEVERNVALKHQANVDLLGSMPDASQFFPGEVADARATGLGSGRSCRKASRRYVL